MTFFLIFSQVNHNGHLTFSNSYSSYIPQRFPLQESLDIIAPFWTDMDIRLTGLVLYNQYTNGSVLQQATQDINSYFPNLNFSAEWVFVATWYEVAYYPTTGTVTTFQAVLISGGEKSFVLMNYGFLAATVWNAGYDTIGSVHHLTIPGSFSSSASGVNSTFTLGSNVNVTGRWAFRVDNGFLPTVGKYLVRMNLVVNHSVKVWNVLAVMQIKLLYTATMNTVESFRTALDHLQHATKHFPHQTLWTVVFMISVLVKDTNHFCAKL
uniref:NIDO domain-containing protein n=1 Tax=Oryzias melastigma TaxID=30732 RepID=A0A3B3DB23_ORYME